MYIATTLYPYKSAQQILPTPPRDVQYFLLLNYLVNILQSTLIFIQTGNPSPSEGYVAQGVKIIGAFHKTAGSFSRSRAVLKDLFGNSHSKNLRSMDI